MAIDENVTQMVQNMESYIRQITGADLDEAEYIQMQLLKVKTIHDEETSCPHDSKWF